MFIDDMSRLCGVAGRTETRKHLAFSTAEHQNPILFLSYITKLHLFPNILLIYI